MDRHSFDADPDRNFHDDADPDPDPDWYQNDADPHRGSYPKFHTCWNPNFCFTFSHSFASLQCFIFLISVKDVVILDSMVLKFCEKA